MPFSDVAEPYVTVDKLSKLVWFHMALSSVEKVSIQPNRTMNGWHVSLEVWLSGT